MSDRRIPTAAILIPRELRFAFGYVESKPLPRATHSKGNSLWESRAKRVELYDQTKARIEADLDKARQAGDWGKVNHLAALLAKLAIGG